MGMYTEIYVNVDLKQDAPKGIIDVLRCMCREFKVMSNYDNKKIDDTLYDYDNPQYDEIMSKFPQRFTYLFCNGSYYTPNTTVAMLSYDTVSNQYSLLAKGDIKNYGGEIEQFFKWIAPYAETEFMGYSRYEEYREPTLFFSDYKDSE